MTKITRFFSKSATKLIFLDLMAFSFIALVPVISRQFSLPLYYIEPTRVMLILAIVHTHRKNAYFLALSLPLFSYLISSHPVLLKMMLIAFELVLNVWFFTILTKKIENYFVSMFISITISKLFYYALKYIFVSSSLISGELLSTPVYTQLILSIILSLYIHFIWKRKRIIKLD